MIKIHSYGKFDIVDKDQVPSEESGYELRLFGLRVFKHTYDFKRTYKKAKESEKFFGINGARKD